MTISILHWDDQPLSKKVVQRDHIMTKSFKMKFFLRQCDSNVPTAHLPGIFSYFSSTKFCWKETNLMVQAALFYGSCHCPSLTVTLLPQHVTTCICMTTGLYCTNLLEVLPDPSSELKHAALCPVSSDDIKIQHYPKSCLQSAFWLLDHMAGRHQNTSDARHSKKCLTLSCLKEETSVITVQTLTCNIWQSCASVYCCHLDRLKAG